MRFLRIVLASVVGLVVFFGILILVLIGIASSAASEQEVDIEDQSVLRIELDKPIVERDIEEPLSSMLFPGSSNGSIGLIGLNEAIKKAKEDDRIKGIYLDAGISLAGFASLKEIRNSLLDFKESGKFIIAYSEILSERAYYLTSIADYIYLHPLGDLEFNGLVVEVTFIKNMLEKLGVEPQVFRVGDFKSAIEPLTRTDMSDSSRLQTQEYVSNMYNVFLEEISASRNIPVVTLREIADSMKVRSPEEAKTYGLITDTAYYDIVLQTIAKELNLEDSVELNEDDINFVSLKNYEKAIGQETEDYTRNRVAVIVATGTIINGEGEGSVIGGETFAKEIRKARLDDNIKAIVLRINSGGGSALASDIMWREIQLAKKVKPVIASMSDVAASGGYYMAMGCDTIVAHPNTITGSIGIFGVVPNAQELLQKIGVTTDYVQTGQFSNLFSLTRPMSSNGKQIIQNQVEQGYEDFTRKAANGRNMSQAQLKSVASGRVWSGVEAKEKNLIDVFGGLDVAIEIALDKAGLEDDYQIKYYPKQKTFFEQIMTELGQEIRVYQLKRELGIAYPFIHKLKELEYLQGIQARMPFEIEVK
ncbi:signal peptide peptidase SppA [Catalinimonas niigatensis]|uniref:signal peptide peptidase SppA n=1 Tax=Catalinimonas niigatensis TaxID=1397264 RepID=UPI002664F204|nr:signal peptide peptidase SppA [Catalinimonas niigatensis]WPP51425.1 signal peptide peptidase SppA [Catalinimonas niigatensis]